MGLSDILAGVATGGVKGIDTGIKRRKDAADEERERKLAAAKTMIEAGDIDGAEQLLRTVPGYERANFKPLREKLDRERKKESFELYKGVEGMGELSSLTKRNLYKSLGGQDITMPYTQLTDKRVEAERPSPEFMGPMPSVRGGKTVQTPVQDLFSDPKPEVGEASPGNWVYDKRNPEAGPHFKVPPNPSVSWGVTPTDNGPVYMPKSPGLPAVTGSAYFGLDADLRSIMQSLPSDDQLLNAARKEVMFKRGIDADFAKLDAPLAAQIDKEAQAAYRAALAQRDQRARQIYAEQTNRRGSQGGATNNPAAQPSPTPTPFTIQGPAGLPPIPTPGPSSTPKPKAKPNPKRGESEAERRLRDKYGL